VREVKPFPRRGLSMLIYAALIISGLIQLICSLWQHVATTAAASFAGILSGEGLEAHIGGLAMALAWVSCLLLLLDAFGLRIMMDSILVLEEVFDTTDDGSIYLTLRSRGLVDDQ